MHMTIDKLKDIKHRLVIIDEPKELLICDLEKLTVIFNKDLEDILNYGPDQLILMIDTLLNKVFFDNELDKMYNYNKIIRSTM